MAKFCTECGSELNEGKCPKCKTEKINNIDFVASLKKYVEIFKSSFTKPATILKENNIEDNFIVGLISCGITSILGGLFICAIIKTTFSGFGSFVEIPYLKVFIIGFLLIALILSSIALIGYLVFDKLFKAKTSIKKLFTFVGLSSTTLTVALLISSILALISLNEMSANIIFALIAISSLLWMVNMVRGYENYITKIDENKLGYSFAIIYSITIMITYFLTNNILPSIFS